MAFGSILVTFVITEYSLVFSAKSTQDVLSSLRPIIRYQWVCLVFFSGGVREEGV